MRVELFSNLGCPNAAAARALVAGCLRECRLAVPITERVGRYPSPTVLVDGVDVMGEPPSGWSAEMCRLDVPTAARVRVALRRAMAAEPGSE